jgi:hypothetical protein
VSSASGFELAHDSVALACGSINRHEIVIVQADAHGADLCQKAHCVNWRKGWAHGVAEGIATAVADRPKPKRELVLGLGYEGIMGHCLVSFQK